MPVLDHVVDAADAGGTQLAGHDAPVNTTWYWCVVEAPPPPPPPATVSPGKGLLTPTRRGPGDAGDALPRNGHVAQRTGDSDAVCTVLTFSDAPPGGTGVAAADGVATVGTVAAAAASDGGSGLAGDLDNGRPPVVSGKPLSDLRIAFVDDEPANCRLGLRLLTKLGVAAHNVTVMTDGTGRSNCSHSLTLQSTALRSLHSLLVPAAGATLA